MIRMRPAWVGAHEMYPPFNWPSPSHPGAKTLVLSNWSPDIPTVSNPNKPRRGHMLPEWEKAGHQQHHQAPPQPREKVNLHLGISHRLEIPSSRPAQSLRSSPLLSSILPPPSIHPNSSPPSRPGQGAHGKGPESISACPESAPLARCCEGALFFFAAQVNKLPRTRPVPVLFCFPEVASPPQPPPPPPLHTHISCCTLTQRSIHPERSTLKRQGPR